MQLSIFDEQHDRPQPPELPPHHRSTGFGNFDEFLRTDIELEDITIAIQSLSVIGSKIVNKKRISIYQTAINFYRVCHVEEVEQMRHLLYRFDMDEKEYIHRTIINYRVNQLCHNHYDWLIERRSND